MPGKKNFEQFTNLYSLSKTLRFELRPIGNTQKMLEDNKVFEKDEVVAKNYKEAKKYFDKLHQEFINDTLKHIILDKGLFEKYEHAYKVLKKNQDAKKRPALKKKFDDIAKTLRKEILANFEKNAEMWRDEYASILDDESEKKKVVKLKKLGFFFGAEVFGFLKTKYPEAIIDEKSIFDSFNKFSTYFTGFHQTRKNFYVDNGTSTAVPTRIINDNLPKFIDNKIIFEEKYLGKHDEIFTSEEKEIFTLNYFVKCLTQDQIEKYNDVISAIKSKINEKRQKAERKTDFPFFSTLFKQILAERSAKATEQSNFIEITTDKEVFEILQEFINENNSYVPKANELFEKFVNDQLGEKNEFEIDKIYVAGRFINTISNKYFADWNTIRTLFVEKGAKKIPEFVSVQVLKEKLQGVEIAKEDFFANDYEDVYSDESDYYKIFFKIWKKEFVKTLQDLEKEKSIARKMVVDDRKYTNKKGLLRDGKTRGEYQKENMRLYAEMALFVYQMMKYFSLEKKQKGNDKPLWNPDGLELDVGFYNAFSEYYQNVSTWQYFNVFRNYLTKKPYSEDKIKLNFENGTLLDGWDINKESDNFAIILKKDGKYYCGLMHKVHNHIFDQGKSAQEMQENLEEGFYEKMFYKFLPDPKRMLPKVCFSKKNLDLFQPSEEIIEIREEESFKKNDDNFSLDHLHKMIDYYKGCLKKYPDWQVFDFVHIKQTNQYTDNIGEFYADIQKNSWKIWFEKVSESYVDKKVRDGELYLFEIYNKDFGEKASGKKNLHTLFWEEIFSEENQKNPIIKLNGGAEVFFRKASVKAEVDSSRKTPHAVIKNKRYTEDKIFFHCPLTLNYTKDVLAKDKERYRGKADVFSIIAREYLTNNPNVNIIGIDRGEKHLAYYSVIDQKGNILEINSFNVINGVDYHAILDKLEKDRDTERKTWQEIGKIKDMKKGYVSQVVKKICDLMAEYNAIVVFEDLNVGFKRGRFAIEKQIYQNLELALAKKLNYFVQKEKRTGECGHHTKAYQLTPKIDNFKDIYKQCGFMFYIPASYTSAICPVCGFRKNIPTPAGTLSENKEFIEKFDIVYKDNHFVFSYNSHDLTSERKKKRSKKSDGFRLFDDVISKDHFIFYSDVERLQYSKKDKKTHTRNPNKELQKIFSDNGIDITSDINKQIIASSSLDNKNFFEKVIWQLRLILQLRNADSKEGRDFIKCPSCRFHSEKDLKGLGDRYHGEGTLVFNGDANGAYNIARKGNLVLKKINYFGHEGDVSLMENKDLLITQEEWDKFTQ